MTKAKKKIVKKAKVKARAKVERKIDSEGKTYVDERTDAAVDEPDVDEMEEVEETTLAYDSPADFPKVEVTDTDPADMTDAEFISWALSDDVRMPYWAVKKELLRRHIEEDVTISALNPNTVESGTADIVMYVSGTGFIPSVSEIMFGDYAEPTTFNEDGTLSTGIKPEIFAPAVVPVRVRNGEDKISEPLDFTFTAPPAP